MCYEYEARLPSRQNVFRFPLSEFSGSAPVEPKHSSFLSISSTLVCFYFLVRVALYVKSQGPRGSFLESPDNYRARKPVLSLLC